MSLRDQLLKAGLVSADAVQKAEKDRKQQKHQQQKQQSPSQRDAQKLEAERQRQAEAEAKRQRDRELNAKREAEKQRQANLARVSQLVEAHRLNDARAEDRYNFPDGRFVRSVRVTAAQRRQIALGQIGIVRMDAKNFDFALVPRAEALKVQEIVPERLALLYEESDGLEEDDWGDW